MNTHHHSNIASIIDNFSIVTFISNHVCVFRAVFKALHLLYIYIIFLIPETYPENENYKYIIQGVANYTMRISKVEFMIQSHLLELTSPVNPILTHFKILYVQIILVDSIFVWELFYLKLLWMMAMSWEKLHKKKSEYLLDWKLLTNSIIVHAKKKLVCLLD